MISHSISDLHQPYPSPLNMVEELQLTSTPPLVTQNEFIAENSKFSATLLRSSDTTKRRSRSRRRTFHDAVRSDHFRSNKRSSNYTSSVLANFCLVLLVSIECSHAAHSEPRQECEVIQPIFIRRDQIDERRNTIVGGCPNELDLSIESSFLDDETITIHLVKNQRLISDTYFETSRQQNDAAAATNEKPTTDDTKSVGNPSHKHQFISLHNFSSNDEHCHYHESAENNLNPISAISIVNSKLLSGLLIIGTRSFYLIADVPNSATIISRPTATYMTTNDWSACSVYSKQTSLLRDRRDTSSRSSPKRRRYSKSNPDNKVLQQPFQSNSSSLYVELLVVHDHSQYVDNNGNASLIAERTMQIVNIMNAFYRQLNIFVALVGVVLWTEKDEIQLTEDGDVTLTNFLKYRYEKLLPKYHHDNAQLITSTSFNGSVVGKALKGPICTHDHSGGVNTDHSHNPAIVAVTLAHELGHNLGMEHDEDKTCKCPDEKCIMSSSSSFVHPKHWSSCSIDYLDDSRKHGLLDCLINEPTQIFGPVCGNGFVEEGEDCDIGEPIPSYGTSKSRSNKNQVRSSGVSLLDPNMLMRNPCCDRSTCKFTTNSTCAQGPCCDLTKCSVFSADEAKVCRSRKTECDIEEVCDGSSELCPHDVHYHDGIECGPTVNLADNQAPASDSAIYNRSRAFCYQGRCASHESQCQLLWGPTGSTSRDICYEQNIHGNTSGNCGFNRGDKVYESCDMDNAACGMLHCVHNQISLSDPNRKTGKLNYGFESASILTVSFFVLSNQAKIYCHGAIIDAGPGMRDPGLVPNGAACGEDRMCLNQKCVSIYDVQHHDWCPSDCNGNGVCDNTGVCHCNDGTIGTSCYQFFGSNFHLSLILYMIMFFGPIIAIIVLAANHYRAQIKMWWFLHNHMNFLRNKAREPRRTAYDANGLKVSISEPIPLNPQTNGNGGGFSDTANNFDPWAESSCQLDSNGKSLGYRLEPIKSKQPAPPLPPLPDYHTDAALPPLPLPPHYPRPSAVAASRRNEDLKPVRAAPPPPIPPHRR